MWLLAGGCGVRVLDREDRLRKRRARTAGDVLPAVHVDASEPRTGRRAAGRASAEVRLVHGALRVVGRTDHDVALAVAVEVTARDQRAGRIGTVGGSAEARAGGLTARGRERLSESR